MEKVKYYKFYIFGIFIIFYITLEIKFNYDLNNDNMEDVVRELQRAIELSEVEYNIINLKLSEFSKNWKNYYFCLMFKIF
jgi:hypothetical protein